MIAAEHEQAQDGPGDFEDAVLVELSDVEHELYGLVRVARVPGSAVSLMGLFFVGDRLVARRVEDRIPVEVESWDRVALDGIRLETTEPLRRWTAAFSAEGGGFEVEATATSGPIDLNEPPTASLARTAGTSRYEQLCEIRGEARVNGARRELSGVGRRVHAWGIPDNHGGDLRRSLYAVWGGEGLALTAVRPQGSDGHGEELVGAYLTGAGDGEGGAEQAPPMPAPFEEARVSTIYDREGAIRKAGLELYVPGDEYPRRASGEARAATVVEGERAKVAISFLRWSVQGVAGQGSYQVVSPA
jgi:hypothetical protein